MSIPDELIPTDASINNTGKIIDLPKLSARNPSTSSLGNNDKEPNALTDDKRIDTQMQFALRNHVYVTDYIKVADQKAGFIFAICTSFLVYLFGKSYHTSLLTSIHNWSFYEFLKGACFVLLITSISFSFWVIKPRLTKYKSKGLIFWETVSLHDTSNDYVQDVIGKSRQNIVNEILEHHYALSKICSTKYWFLNKAIFLGLIGIISGILVIVF